MRNLSILVVIALAACGGDDKKTDASVGGDTGGTIDTNGTSDTPAGGLDCNTYCTKIMGACTGANAQYSSMANCVDSCANFPVGAAADQMGNTLGCRINHATLAMTTPGTHCVHAGPGGAGTCGMDCAGFCSIVVAECPTQWNMTTCNSNQTGCPSFTSTPPYKAPSAGDTLQCRLYHATMAASDPGGHCGHTIEASTVCQ